MKTLLLLFVIYLIFANAKTGRMPSQSEMAARRYNQARRG